MNKNKNTNFAVIFFLAIIILFTLMFIFFEAFSPNKTENTFKTIEEEINYSAEEQPRIGDKKASIELIEFGDYNCSYCQRWDEEIFPKLKKDYIDNGIVSLTFLNYQFLEPTSIYAGIASELVYELKPSVFWEFHSELYKQSKKGLTPERLAKIAKNYITDIDENQFSKDIEDGKYLYKVLLDKQKGMEMVVNETPTLFIDGMKISDAFNYEEIRKMIDSKFTQNNFRED